jgi:DNA-binding transcriptional MerR regulator
MVKSPEAFRTISEVADWLDRPTHVLRFWESKFPQVKPVKRAGGRRYYRPQDMLLLGGIKKLLHDDGMTIKGVQKLLREQGIAHVSSHSQPLEEGLEAGADVREALNLGPEAGQQFDEAPMVEEALDNAPAAQVLPFPDRARDPDGLSDDETDDDALEEANEALPEAEEAPAPESSAPALPQIPEPPGDGSLPKGVLSLVLARNSSLSAIARAQLATEAERLALIAKKMREGRSR